MKIAGQKHRQKDGFLSLFQLNIKKILMGAALALLLFGTMPGTAFAESRDILGGVAQTNNTGAARTDFHMKISSDTNINCVGAGLGGGLTVDGGPQVAAGVQNNNTQTVTLTWDVAIPQGANVKAAFRCTQEEENKYTVDAFFTPQNSPTDSPSLGWRVTPAGDVFLMNDYPSAISFNDVRFQFPSQATIDSMLALVAGPSSGDPASVPSGTVPQGSPSAPGELSIDQVSLNVGDFLTARVDTSFVDPGFSGLQATIAIGHEHQVKPVGGIPVSGELAGLPLETAQSSGRGAGVLAGVIAGLTASAVALGGAAWYTRRRWLI